MEFYQLTYFLAAAQTQNFRKAAELCLVAQSALSRQIAALEDELKVTLFTRNKKRVALTPAGQEFALYVRKAMEQLQEGQQFLAELQAGQRGTVRCRLHRIAGNRFLTGALCLFSSTIPPCAPESARRSYGRAGDVGRTGRSGAWLDPRSEAAIGTADNKRVIPPAAAPARFSAARAGSGWKLRGSRWSK